MTELSEQIENLSDAIQDLTTQIGGNPEETDFLYQFKKQLLESPTLPLNVQSDHPGETYGNITVLTKQDRVQTTLVIDDILEGTTPETITYTLKNLDLHTNNVTGMGLIAQCDGIVRNRLMRLRFNVAEKKYTLELSHLKAELSKRNVIVFTFETRSSLFYALESNTEGVDTEGPCSGDPSRP